MFLLVSAGACLLLARALACVPFFVGWHAFCWRVFVWRDFVGAFPLVRFGFSLEFALEFWLDFSLHFSLDFSLDSLLDFVLDFSLDFSIDVSLDLSLDLSLDFPLYFSLDFSVHCSVDFSLDFLLHLLLACFVVARCCWQVSAVAFVSALFCWFDCGEFLMVFVFTFLLARFCCWRAL